ncbi:MAG: YmdB family metallophosphoesterase, partial [Treponema sp.]|nr:YmdB family metallophosphoesterase [Treponema sp.]
MAVIRVIMIGDVVGDPGLEVLEKRLPVLRAEYRPLLVTVNGENAAAGFGLTEESLNRIFAAGADVVTSGNHIWEKREFWPVLESGRAVLRPANYPDRLPGSFFFPANPPESGPAADDVPADGSAAGAPVGPPEAASDGSAKPGKKDVPGKGWLVLEKPVPEPLGETIPAGSAPAEKRISFLVINLQGRKRMTAIDCPFRCFDRILAESAGQGKKNEAETIGSGKNPRAAESLGGSVVIVDFH